MATVLLDSNDAIIVHDFDGKVTTWNRGAEQMYGFQRSRKLADDEYRPNDSGGVASRASCLLGTVLKGRTRQFLGDSTLNEGREAHPRRVGYCHRPGRGRSPCCCKTDRDITKRKELEREVVEIASLEQRRIGNDLHDSVGQELGLPSTSWPAT